MAPSARSHNRPLRKLLGLPCILTFIASLYAPETAGIASHWIGFQPFRPTITCQIRIPRTWILWSCDNATLSATAAPGMAQIGFSPYWHDQIPVSDMGFYPVPHPEQQLDKNVPLRDATILAKRSFAFGNESLDCWDLIWHNKFVGAFPRDPSIANIRCSSDREDFYAYFVGWRGYSTTFYNVLQQVRHAK